MAITTNPEEFFENSTPRRIVSLVPSYTESLFSLGFGKMVVGVTNYCIHPADGVKEVAKVGGPKNAGIADVLQLAPDLVLANREENTQELVETLSRSGALVWLTFPCTVQESLADLWKIARLYHSEVALQQVGVLERSVEWAEMALLGQTPVRYFCPIWQERPENGEPWWMTFNAETFSHDILRLVGGENVFADRIRRYPIQADLGRLPAEAPGSRDTRYPRVRREEIIAAGPELILLPDEPFAYSDDHLEQLKMDLAETPAVKNNRIVRIDGSLITWCGTRVGLALEELPAHFLPPL